MMTALADKGVLQVTDPVTKYFNEKDEPAFSPKNPYDPELGAAAVTLESLATTPAGCRASRRVCTASSATRRRCAS